EKRIQERGGQKQGTDRRHRRDRGRQAAVQASGIAGAKAEDGRKRRQEGRQERGRQRQGNVRRLGRDRGRQAAAQASGTAAFKTEGARDRGQEKGRQRQGEFRQHRQLRRGLARDGKLGPAIRSRAHGELKSMSLILESMLLLLRVREGEDRAGRGDAAQAVLAERHQRRGSRG